MKALTPAQHIDILIRMFRYAKADEIRYATEYGDIHRLTIAAEGYARGLASALLSLTQDRNTVTLPA